MLHEFQVYSKVIQSHIHAYILFSFLSFFLSFCFSRAAPAAYGDSQARGLIGAVATSLCLEPQQCGIQAMSAQLTAMPDP